MTGQWTYQLYGAQQQTQGYPHLQHHQQHHQQQHQHLMAPMQRVSYSSQQHTAHLTHHHYNPNSLHHNSPPLGPVSPPHMWQQQHQWGLLSPSAHSSGVGTAAAGTAVGFGALGWSLSSDDGDDEDDEDEEAEAWAAEKKAGGTWDKFFDGRGLPVWIHSKTGSRTSVNPATA